MEANKKIKEIKERLIDSTIVVLFLLLAPIFSFPFFAFAAEPVLSDSANSPTPEKPYYKPDASQTPLHPQTPPKPTPQPPEMDPGPLLPPSPPVETIQKSENFDTNPHWINRNNRILPNDPLPLPVITQDFGYSDSNFAGGRGRGEIGGRIQRSYKQSYYGYPMDHPLTLESAFSVEGTFALVSTEGDSSIMVGFFNHEFLNRGWRPAHWLGFRVDLRAGAFRVLVDYTTAQWESVAQPPRQPQSFSQDAYTIPLDGRPHHFQIRYDPFQNEGKGVITFNFDRGAWKGKINLPPGQKIQGTTFTRFGMFNVTSGGPSGAMRFYLDDLTLRREGEKTSFNFSSNPHWEEVRNRTSFRDRHLEGRHDFGYSPDTHRAGGKTPGEIGGLIWRIEPEEKDLIAYYADKISRGGRPLTFNDRLEASGTVAMTRGSADSAVYLGWFDPDNITHPPRNFVGILIEGPTRVGWYFRPAYGTRPGDANSGSQIIKGGPRIRPDKIARTWNLVYDPKVGSGRMTVTLDGQTISLDLTEAHRAAGAKLTHFGMFTYRKGGHEMKIYFDDLTYTASAPTQPSLAQTRVASSKNKSNKKSEKR